MSFLSYLIRTHADRIRTHKVTICAAIANLLRKAPDNVTLRKELMVNLRNMLKFPLGAQPTQEALVQAAAADIQACFLPHLPVLLEDKSLIGSSLACQEVSGRGRIDRQFTYPRNIEMMIGALGFGLSRHRICYCMHTFRDPHKRLSETLHKTQP